jgi:hypothetical protein
VGYVSSQENIFDLRKWPLRRALRIGQGKQKGQEGQKRQKAPFAFFALLAFFASL